MTGEELAGIRRQLDMGHVTFGTKVLGHKGSRSTVYRAVRRLEICDEVPQQVIIKALAALRGHIKRIRNGGY